MNFLPTELILMIFSHLDQGSLYACAGINAQFHAIANPMLWKYVYLDHPFLAIWFLYSLVGARHPVGQLIRSVHLRGFSWSNNTLLALIHRTPFLEHLVLDTAARVSDDTLQHLAHYCPRIQSLYLAYSPITHLTYQALGQRCLQLTDLSLWCCPFLRPDTFSTYFTHSPLRSLMVASWMTEEQEEQADEEDPWLVNETTLDLTGLHSLTSLKVHGAPFGMIQNVINRGVAACWPQLKALHLEACFDVMDEDAMRLMDGFSGCRLTSLTLKDGAFTNETLDVIAASQPNLIALDVSSNDMITVHGLNRLIYQCTHLAYIKLSYCAMITLQDFPDAGPHCTASMVTFDGTYTGLDYLDGQALDAIRRRGPDNYDGVDDDDDQEASDGEDDK